MKIYIIPNINKIILIILFTLLVTLQANAQTDEKTVEISQETAKACRNNFLELQAVKEKVVVLEEADKLREKNEADLKETARVNEAALIERLHRTEVDLALKTGQLIGAEAERVRLISLVEFLAKNTKK